MTDVVIVGGGSAGLAAALRLRRLAPGLGGILVEREQRLGGKILTQRDRGYVVEAGPDSMLSRKPRGTGLCRELGIGERMIGRRPEHRRSSVLCAGRLLPLPEGLSGVVPTDLEALRRTGLLSEEGRMRLSREPEVPPSQNEGDESLAAFFTRRLGREAYERLVEPLTSGIYGSSGESTSLAATFPWLREMEREHGSVLRGLAASAQPPAAGPAAAGSAAAAPALPPFVSFPLGMAEIVEAMEARLPGFPILRGAAAASVSRTAGGWAVSLADGAVLEARSVIVAVPAPAAARMLEPLDAELAALLSRIRFSSCAVVSLAFDLQGLPAAWDGSGYVVPRSAESRVMASTFASNKWPGRAPEGRALARVFLAWERGRADGDGLAGEAAAELRRTLGIAAQPLAAWTHVWEEALPHYRVGHLEGLRILERRLARHHGLFVAGASYNGLGVPDCIRSGEEAAERAAASLGAAPIQATAAAALPQGQGARL